MKKFFLRYHLPLLFAVLAFAFVTRVARIHLPESYVFDEVYHAVTAKLIARNDPWAYEWWNPPVEPNTAVDWLHPPYAKYTQAFFILMFGENTFGWRISSVIFGVLTIVMVYKLAQELFENKNLSLLATFLASLDGLLLVQSRVAMNDIHVTFLILLSLFFYARFRRTLSNHFLILASFSAGLAMGTKWSGLFALITLIVFEASRLFRDCLQNKSLKHVFKKIPLLIFSLFILPFGLYLASYTHMFAQGKSLFCFENKSIEGECYKEKLKYGPFIFDGYLSHFGELHRQIWWYQTGLTATHGYQSRPWQWFLNIRPVWFYVDYEKNTLSNIYSQGNSMLFWIGDIAIIGSVLVWFFKSLATVFTIVIKKLRIKLSKKTNLQIQTLTTFSLPKNFTLLIFAYFIVWLPWQLSPRIMFFYHYTPAVPLLAIILAYWLIRISSYKVNNFAFGKLLIALTITLCSLNFIVFYPNWTGIKVSDKIFKPIYFALKSWK